jgi:release factor glutamine methyltransferase
MTLVRDAAEIAAPGAAGRGAPTGRRIHVTAPSPSLPDNPAPPVSRAKLMERGCSLLRAAGIDSPRREARLLLAHSVQLTTADLLRDPHRPADPMAYESVLARRAAREPLAYILGEREFWSLNFAVSTATLIPRPESEILIEAALAAFAGRAPPQRILDLGSGSGCLLLAALHEFSHAFGIGVDRSIAAVRLAAANAAVLGLARRAAFLSADWSAPLRARFDLVLCNPPYIPTSAIGGLMPEVARHEPVTALDGGPDGLAAYRQIIALLGGLLPRDGVAILELGVGQDAAVAALAKARGMGATTRPDLAGIPRAMVLTRTTV